MENESSSSKIRKGLAHPATLYGMEEAREFLKQIHELHISQAQIKMIKHEDKERFKKDPICTLKYMIEAYIEMLTVPFLLAGSIEDDPIVGLYGIKNEDVIMGKYKNGTNEVKPAVFECLRDEIVKINDIAPSVDQVREAYAMLIQESKPLLQSVIKELEKRGSAPEYSR
jgi:hypothetical protein